MNFHIAHAGYRVKVRDGLLTDEHGRKAAGLCNWSDHIVWLAGPKQMLAQRRPETLFHELWHAWRAEFGKTNDEEAEANQVAAFALTMWQQLERQGGLAALMRLESDGVIHQDAGVEIPGEPRPAQCPKCNGLLSMPIRTSSPALDPQYARLVVRRAADCDFCGHTVSWREAATTKGVPTGTVIGESLITSAET